MSNPHLLTVGEARAWIMAHGQAFESVARRIGASKYDLNQVFAGKSQGNRGKSYRLHVALRLKPAPDDWSAQDFAVPAAATVRRWLRQNGVAPVPHPSRKAA